MLIKISILYKEKIKSGAHFLRRSTFLTATEREREITNNKRKTKTTTKVRLFVLLRRIDPRITYTEHINGTGNGINNIWIPDIELNGLAHGLLDAGKNKYP